MNHFFKKQNIVALVAGCLYGLLIRVVGEMNLLSDVFEIISFSFLIFTPFSIGAIAIYIASKSRKILWKEQVFISSGVMFFFLFSMFISFLEGLICIVLILPVFMIASIVGGLIMGFVINHSKYSKGTLNTFLILPLLVNPIETMLPEMGSSNAVTTKLIINASPKEIFSELASVKDIKEHELGFSFMHFIGMPRPLEASMSGQGVGAVRTSRWDKGVSFDERITVWNSPHQLHYEFIIPKGSIPREALDRHVELGGDYFTVIEGGYDINVISSTVSELTLTTVYENKSRLQIYGNLWAKYVLTDFHFSLLTLMKNRAENNRS